MTALDTWLGELVGQIVVIIPATSKSSALIGTLLEVSSDRALHLQDVAFLERIHGAGYSYDPVTPGSSKYILCDAGWFGVSAAGLSLAAHYTKWLEYTKQAKEAQ